MNGNSPEEQVASPVESSPPSNRYLLSRRDALKGTAGFVVLAAFSDCGTAETEEPAYVVPGVEDLYVGEAHLVWDSEGNQYELDPHLHRISRVDADGNAVWTAQHDDSLTFDEQDRAISVWDKQVGAAGLDLIVTPADIVSGTDGTLYVVSQCSSSIVVLNAETGAFIKSIGTFGSGEGEFGAVTDIAVDTDGRLFVADADNHCIHILQPDGTHVKTFGDFGVEEAHHLNHPRAVAISPAGEVHVVDAGNARLHVYDLNGTWKRNYGGYDEEGAGIMMPRSVGIDPLGNSYVADPTSAVVQMYTPTGEPLKRNESITVGGEKAYPLRVSWDARGIPYIRVYIPVVEPLAAEFLTDKTEDG